MKNISVWIGAIIFVLSIIAGAITVKVTVANNDKRLDKVEDKVEILQTSTTKIDTQQIAIQKDIDEVDKKIDKIIDLMTQRPPR